jgi:phosphoserine phosphatase
MVRLQHDPQFRAAIFDLGGTLTDTRSSWQYLHQRFGTLDVGRRTAELYRDGRIDYVEWAKRDAALLERYLLGRPPSGSKQDQIHIGCA